MTRITLLGLLGVVLGTVTVPAQQDDKVAPLKQALALQEVVQTVIDEADPSIACILVSRSEAYQTFGQGTPTDQPGKLGDFNPTKLEKNKLFTALSDAERDRLRKRLNLADPGHVPESFGSGVVVDEKGLVLTNFHVVRDATKIFVRLPDQKGSYADIYAADPRSDLAVLRLLNDKLTLRPLPLGDGGQARRGQFVVALANPFAASFFDGKPSASFGIISNVRRRAPSPPREAERTKTLHHYGTLLQTDVRLNVGCSGGALLDVQGKLIGLTSALAGLHGGDTPGGFAIPIDTGMKRIIEVLKRGQEVEYGFLGVGFDPAAGSGDGVVLGSVAEGSPAAKELKAREVILAVNGVQVHDSDDLFLALGTLLAGARVELDVRKVNGGKKKVTVRLAKFYVPGQKIATVLTPRPFARGLRVDYTSVLVQQPELNIQKIPPGVLVTEVQPKAQLKPGDIITHVNKQPVNLPEEFYELVSKPGPVEVTLAATNEGQPAPTKTIP